MLERPLHAHLPPLAASVPFVQLADLPTPVEPLAALRASLGAHTPELWIKRDDLTASAYGGNKVRTLEVLFADARKQGASHVFSTGAFGSNHALATAIHAPRAGLTPGALLFPQPQSAAARDNLRATLDKAAEVHELPHWSFLPYGLLAARARDLRLGRRSYVMVPGGATPLGALGYVSAALELGEQVAAGELPAPRVLVVAVGSTCTTAGLLLGLQLASQRGLGFSRPPRVHAVRVTPWPVTSHARIVQLAERTGALLGSLLGASARGWRAPTREALAAGLRVDNRFLGAGYGRVTHSGVDAIARFRAAGGPPLDTGYSGKSGAAFVRLAQQGTPGPLLFWATKSSAALPEQLRGPAGPARASLARMQAFLSAAP